LARVILPISVSSFAVGRRQGIACPTASFYRAEPFVETKNLTMIIMLSGFRPAEANRPRQRRGRRPQARHTVSRNSARAMPGIVAASTDPLSFGRRVTTPSTPRSASWNGVP